MQLKTIMLQKKKVSSKSLRKSKEIADEYKKEVIFFAQEINLLVSDALYSAEYFKHFE